MNPKVDFFFAKAKQWQAELEQLRQLVLGCGLTEELKWGVPCYTHQKSNILLLHGFKGYCAMLFFKGTLMQDAAGILVAQTERVQATRQARFTSTEEISGLAGTLRAYIQEAVAAEEAGLQVIFKKTAEFSVPDEFQQQLTELPALQPAFEALTPGRQRAYLLYFAAPKQPKTRAARIKRSLPGIFAGKGLDDK